MYNPFNLPLKLKSSWEMCASLQLKSWSNLSVLGADVFQLHDAEKIIKQHQHQIAPQNTHTPSRAHPLQKFPPSKQLLCHPIKKT